MSAQDEQTTQRMPHPPAAGHDPHLATHPQYGQQQVGQPVPQPGAPLPAGYPPPGTLAQAAPPPPPAVVPPVPPAQPKERGPGFWIAVSAGVAALVMLLLLGGFMLGRSSRLSDDEVQTKIVQQRQADQLAQQRQVQELADRARKEKGAAVRRAADRARASALRQGRAEGRQTGYENGLSEGQAQGQAAGQAAGQSEGYSQGFNDALCLSSPYSC